jgi:hypothetical protein
MRFWASLERYFQFRDLELTNNLKIEKMREVRDQKLLKIAEIEQKTQAVSFVFIFVFVYLSVI